MKRLTDDHKATMRALRALGLSYEDIAKDLGFDGSYIAKVGLEMGLPAGKRKLHALAAAWTPQRVALLTQLWMVDGLSATRIGLEMRITRNAVIGKVNRLGLNRGRASVPKCAPTKSAAPKHRAPSVKRGPDNPLGNRKAKIKIPRAFSNPVQARVFGSPTAYTPTHPDKPFTPSAPVIFDAACACRLMDLTDKRCKWPLGDPQSPTFVFCGRPKDSEIGPYCIDHRRLAYKPPEAAKTAKELVRSLRKHIAA